MPVLDLTTLERLKAFGNITGSRDDAVLSSMVTYVSQKFEQYCSRLFLVGPDAESRILRGTMVPVKRYPIASVQSVQVATTGRTSGLAAISSDQYEISPDGGAVRVWDVSSGSLVVVNYTGGLADNTTVVIANEPVLEGACKLQTVNLWQRHTSPDKSGLTIVQGETHWEGAYKMLDDVRRDLDQNYNARHRFL